MDWRKKLFGKIPIVRGVKGEDGECIAFASHLQRMTRQGECTAVWFHVQNEYSGDHNPRYGAVRKAMGKVAGVADYIFMWGSGCMALEFKDGKGKQSENQQCFQIWCDEMGVAYHVVRSKEEALSLLHSAGIISQKGTMSH